MREALGLGIDIGIVGERIIFPIQSNWIDIARIFFTYIQYSIAMSYTLKPYGSDATVLMTADVYVICLAPYGNTVIKLAKSNKSRTLIA